MLEFFGGEAAEIFEAGAGGFFFGDAWGEFLFFEFGLVAGVFVFVVRFLSGWAVVVAVALAGVVGAVVVGAGIVGARAIGAGGARGVIRARAVGTGSVVEAGAV